jgi:hypothetical protein
LMETGGFQLDAFTCQGNSILVWSMVKWAWSMFRKKIFNFANSLFLSRWLAFFCTEVFWRNYFTIFILSRIKWETSFLNVICFIRWYTFLFFCNTISRLCDLYFKLRRFSDFENLRKSYESWLFSTFLFYLVCLKKINTFWKSVFLRKLKLLMSFYAEKNLFKSSFCIKLKYHHFCKKNFYKSC